MKEFVAAPYKDWHVDGKVAGELNSYDKLTFLQVEGASHMVPKDQPESALDMLKRFLNNQPFDNYNNFIFISQLSLSVSHQSHSLPQTFHCALV